MDEQQIFIEAIENLKSYAKLNGMVITKQEILDNLKGIDLQEGQLQLIYGYLKNNQIIISDVNLNENKFEKINTDFIENQNEIDTDGTFTINELEEEADKKLVSMYLEDLKLMEVNHDTNVERLVNDILNGNQNAENDLIEYYLPQVIDWIEPFKNKGIPVGDLIQEGNLVLITMVKNIKKDNHRDVSQFIYILKTTIEDTITSYIEEQSNSVMTGKKILNKVNAVNDCAVNLSRELERKVTIEEVAERMGISIQAVKEAIDLSSNNIEDIIL